MNDPDYEMNMANDKKKLQDNLNADEQSRTKGMSIRDEFDSDGTSFISRGPDSVMGGVREPRLYQNQDKDEVNPANSAYFKKPAAALTQKKLALLEVTKFDKTLDVFIKQFVKAIKTDLQDTNRPAGDFVRKFGMKVRDFIDFSEFKKLYSTHVHSQTEDQYNTPMPSDNLLMALFNEIDENQRGQIARDDF
jgi:hypothetical protein